jgi:hypothetical protein
MRDFKGILQGAIVAVLVVIAGLLFSISRKLDNQSVTPAPPAAVTATTPSAPPASPAQDTAAITPPPNVESNPAVPEREKAKPSPSKKHEEHLARERKDRFADIPERTTPFDTPPVAAAAATPPAPKDPNGIAYTHDPNAAPITAAVPPPPMPVAPAPPPPPPPKTYTVAEGTSFRVRLIDRIDAAKNHAGDTFRASLDENLIVDGTVVANRGSNVVGRLVEDKQAGRVSGVASLTLTVERINTIAGDQTVATDNLKKDAPSTKGKDAKTVGALAGLGAVIGAIAGHGKGAAIGAGAGAGAGTIDVLTTKGKDLKLGPESVLIFRLSSPLTFTADPSRVQQASTNRNSTDGPTTDPADRPYLRRRNP